MVLQEERELHVLAVDDSPVDRALIAMLLRSSKFRGTFPFFACNSQIFDFQKKKKKFAEIRNLLLV